MPTARFRVTVSVREEVGDSNERGRVTADASKYLAYADQTDLFGYHGRVDNVTCNRRHNYAYESVTLEFAAPVANKAELERWQSEMDQLSRVEKAECITNPIEANL